MFNTNTNLDSSSFTKATIFTPDSASSATPPPPSTNLKESTIAIEVLINTLSSNNAESKASLEDRSIDQASGQTQVSIKKDFFNKLSKPVSEKDRQKAKNIDLLIGKVERVLTQMNNLAKKIANKERGLKGRFPNNENTTLSSNDSFEFSKLLEQAKEDLKTLLTKKEEATELADEYQTFGHLPKDIKRMEDNVQYLQTRFTISQEIDNLEVVIKDYHPEEKWDQFVAVQEKKALLATTIKEQLTAEPFKEETEVQTHIQKKELSTHDVHQVVKLMFPGLTGKVERLLDNYVGMEKKRIQTLEKDVETLKSSLFAYNKQSRAINNLEKLLSENTKLPLLESISRIFYRFIYSISRSNLRTQLEDFKKKQQANYQTIMEKTKFNDKELNWLKSKNNPETIKLIQDIETIRKEVPKLTEKHDVANQMDELVENLNKYKKLLEFKIDSFGSNNVKNKKNELLSIIKKDITSKIQKFSQRFQKLKTLPSRFKEVDISDLNQLKAMFSLHFPNLTQRNENLFQLIEKVQLLDDSKESIKTPPIEDEVQVQQPSTESNPLIETPPLTVKASPQPKEETPEPESAQATISATSTLPEQTTEPEPELKPEPELNLEPEPKPEPKTEKIVIETQPPSPQPSAPPPPPPPPPPPSMRSSLSQKTPKRYEDGTGVDSAIPIEPSNLSEQLQDSAEPTKNSRIANANLSSLVSREPIKTPAKTETLRHNGLLAQIMEGYSLKKVKISEVEKSKEKNPLIAKILERREGIDPAEEAEDNDDWNS